MNPFYNPAFLFRLAKSYLTDINRVWRCDYKKLRKYQDKALRNMVKYAYTVPLYHKKYKNAGVHPNDIKSVNDLHKLPFITKQDLRDHYPDEIIPENYEKKYGHIISTSGSTGKPVFIYLDKFSSIKSLMGFARTLKAYGGNWKKSKTVLIIDIEPGSVEHAHFANSAVPFLKKFISLENIKYLHIGEKPEILMKEIEKFNPEFIGSDPNMLRQLATLKNNGHGKNLDIKYLFSSGSILEEYTRHYVQKAFNTKLLDTYGTTEGGPLAFECLNGYYHIHSDFVLLEFLDEKNKPVPNNKPGKIVITKLYGGGTPIIRYTGIDDLVIPIEKQCSCGITTQMIKQIEGRSTELIHLPNGNTLSPLTVTGIPAKTMDDFKSNKISQFQIIQHKIDEVEILIVIDEKQRDKGIPVNDLLKELKKRFINKIGHGIKVTVNEAKKIQKDTRSDYIKVVVSKVNK